MESSFPEASERDLPGRLNRVGGVVVGGDYQGLGIVRSLGRRGYPVCIIDDEHSIARYSKYATHFVRVKNLRDEQETIRAVSDAGRRLKLQDWVLYPTRDETVAAFSLTVRFCPNRSGCRRRNGTWFNGHGTSGKPMNWRNNLALAQPRRGSR